MDDRGRPDAVAAGSVVATLAEVTRVALRRPDTVDVFMLISERAAALLRVEAAGVLVRDGDETLHVVGSSTSATAVLDELRARAIGSAGTFPMVAGDDVVGMLGVLGSESLGRDASALGQALADVAALALLRMDIARDTPDLMRRIHRALQARATLSQAIGVIAERFSLDPDGALRRLRAAADTADVGLVDLAGRVVAREVDGSGMLDLAAEEH